MPGVIKLTDPRKPWQHVKASTQVFYHRIYGGGAAWRSLYTSPWGTFDTFKYAWSEFLNPHPPKPETGFLDVGLDGTDVTGFAIYGLVRVGGVGVIPQTETNK